MYQLPFDCDIQFQQLARPTQTLNIIANLRNPRAWAAFLAVLLLFSLTPAVNAAPGINPTIPCNGKFGGGILRESTPAPVVPALELAALHSDPPPAIGVLAAA